MNAVVEGTRVGSARGGVHVARAQRPAGALDVEHIGAALQDAGVVSMTLFDGTPPDVLVLGGGGLLGEAWMTGVLAGVEDASGIDLRHCRTFVGTSAGSIVSASLAARRSPRRPREMAPPDRPVEDLSGRPSPFAAVNGDRALAGLLLPAGMIATTLGAPLRAFALAALPEGKISNLAFGREVDRWGASFGDGRLRVCTVDQDSGRRVVFGSRSAPQATVGQAVAASCAIPGVFRPVPIAGRRYVDGGAWTPTNGDAAPAGRGDRVLLLEPTALLLRGTLRGVAALETLALRARGATVRAVVPDAAAAVLMNRLMDPDRGGRVLAAGYRQGLELAR